MPSFSYKAKAMTGDIVTGKFDAVDKNMVISALKDRGLFPLDIKEAGSFEKKYSRSRKKVTYKDLALFCKQFYTMVDAGVSVPNSLDLLRKQTENVRFAFIIGKVYEDVKRGKSLSESMKAYKDVFPVILTSMIQVGEISGNIDVVLNRLSIHFEKENKLKQKIKTAMMYPMIIGIIALVMVTVMLVFIVPRFVKMFEMMGAQLPLPTRILLSVSSFVTSFYFVMIVGSLIFFVKFVLDKLKGNLKFKLFMNSAALRIPLVGKNVRKITASRFSRALSLLLKTGVPLIQALEVVDRVVDNQIVSTGLSRVKEDIKKGASLADSIEKVSIFPVMVSQMMSIGEEAGSLDTTIEKIADYYDDELDASISRLIALLEPVMMMGLALVIGLIVIATIMPVFSIYSKLGKPA
ncbi:MAG: type II secretion system F family protein [Clostridia bacterium]|nr:type II secretion system F family protein [Clostridia bacterium]